MDAEQNQKLFAKFAAERLEQDIYAPSQQTEENQAFIISEISARQLMGWANGLTNKRGDQLSVCTGYIEQMTPNALADRFDGHHYIGMHQALLVSIMEFALYAMTQSCMFPQIGNAEGESSPELAEGKAPGIFLLDQVATGQSINQGRDHWRIPKDEQRHATAVYLAMLMARYVWLHELAHCTNGHVAYTQNAGLALRLYEVADAQLSITGFSNDKISKPQRNKILKQVEYDADGSAFFGLCQIQLNELENIDGIKAMDIGTRLGMSIFAAYATTWLFEEYRAYYKRQGDPSHPTPHDRLQYLSWVAVNDIAPKVEGFKAFHKSICDQFNEMNIPKLHGVGKAASITSDQEFELQAVRSALDGFRFY